jgi:hypothetical protein
LIDAIHLWNTQSGCNVIASAGRKSFATIQWSQIGISVERSGSFYYIIKHGGRMCTVIAVKKGLQINRGGQSGRSDISHSCGQGEFVFIDSTLA